MGGAVLPPCHLPGAKLRWTNEGSGALLQKVPWCTASVLCVCTVGPITTLNVNWKDWCWSWSSSTLATWSEEPTHWKRPWCWEWLRAGREGGTRMRWLDGIINSMDMSLSKLQELGRLACCSPWSHKESDTTEQLNNNKSQCSALCLAQIKHSQTRVSRSHRIWGSSGKEAKENRMYSRYLIWNCFSLHRWDHRGRASLCFHRINLPALSESFHLFS